MFGRQKRLFDLGLTSCLEAVEACRAEFLKYGLESGFDLGLTSCLSWGLKVINAWASFAGPMDRPNSCGYWARVPSFLYVVQLQKRFLVPYMFRPLKWGQMEEENLGYF